MLLPMGDKLSQGIQRDSKAEAGSPSIATPTEGARAPSQRRDDAFDGETSDLLRVPTSPPSIAAESRSRSEKNVRRRAH